jgi:hypothetical protein
MIREQWELVGACVFAIALIALAVAERERFACHRGDSVYIGGVLKLYDC